MLQQSPGYPSLGDIRFNPIEDFVIFSEEIIWDYQSEGGKLYLFNPVPNELRGNSLLEIFLL